MQNFDFSRKAILISENKEKSELISKILEDNRIEIETRFPFLHTLPSIVENYTKTGNTTFLRTALVKFIGEVGFPYVIILDYRINLGNSNPDDLMSKKLFRTILISYIILSRGKGFERLKGNFLIFGNSSDIEEINSFEDDPLNALNILKTNNDIVNSFITELKKNPIVYKRLFFIKGINLETTSEEIAETTNKFLSGIADRQKLASIIESKMKSGIQKSEQKAALIVFKDDSNIFVDGNKLTDDTEKYNDLDIGVLHVIGHWTSRTQLEVREKLVSIIKKGFEKVEFSPFDKIKINILGNCTIDGSTANSLGQILFKELIDYKHIRINVSDENRSIFINSTGYSIIEKNIF